jgi:hypothetical protein
MSKAIRIVMLSLLLAAPAFAQAANTVLAGTFDGSEPRGVPLRGTCGGDDALAYQEAGTLQVSATGSYSVHDVLWLEGIKYGGLDVSALIYAGDFSIDQPTANLITPGGIDYVTNVTLNAGTVYTLVVQQWCDNREGAWALYFHGPGTVTSERAVAVPALTEGTLTASDPTATTACGLGPYRQTGPVRVARSGTYHYSDESLFADVFDMCLQVFTAPFDPGNPAANRVATNDLVDTSGAFLDDVGTVELEAGQDYWFVAQPLDIDITGEYFFVLAPPAPFRISKALAGAWSDPETDGQGFLFDVFDNLNAMFMAWFTFDLERPVDATAQLGEPGHRWLVAVGPIDGAQAQLDVTLAQGGVFDAPQPPVDQSQVVGTVSIEFQDCISGTVDYSLTTPVVSGRIEIEPVAGLRDHVELCDAQTRGPGEPGPL